jgi:DNA uptake protein ComE-like DNA-binding protein
MDYLKKWIRNFFGFSSVEINGFLILVPLMVALIASEPLYRMWRVNREPETANSNVLDSLVSLWEIEKKIERVTPRKPSRSVMVSRLFNFDPNSATPKELESLGFNKFLANRIASYRQKGGQFRIKDDLKKIYGVDTALYRRLHGYILLPEKLERHFVKRDSTKATRNDLFVKFDLNAADTAQLNKVYGIGPTLAVRIVKFRDGLGGFISTEQLKEIYGLDSLVVGRLCKAGFISTQFVPKKLDLNSATEKELGSHPYIKKNIAKAIVSYRFQHGAFTNVSDLGKLAQMKPLDVEKIIPYLTITH